MSTPLPPDPYVGLGVGKDATPAQIKTTYRKLVLKCHPDKVMDESKKAQAADDFHRIQQAYEILSDEGRRSRYDAQVKLAALRKEAMERQPSSSPHTNVRTAAYDVPTSSPGRAAFTARGPERVYEERKPQKSSDTDGDYFGDTRTSSRKYDDYGRPVRKAAAKDDTDRVRVYERENKANERFVRKDKGRSRDKENKRERERKFSYPDDDSEPDLRHEAMRRRETESLREKERLAKLDREREREREMERVKERERELRDREKERERAKEREREREREEREKERERDRSRRRPDGYEKTSSRRYTQKEEEARAYIANAGRDKRPSASSSRSASYVDVDRSGRPVMIRRSSTRDKPASPQSSSRRDREREKKLSESDIPEMPEVVEDRRTPSTRASATRPTMLHTAHSSPANIKLPRDRDSREKAMPPRSASAQFDDRDIHDSPRATLRRSETDPINTSPRRRDISAPLKKSGLRQAETTDYLPTPPATPDPYNPKYRYLPDDEPDHPRDRRMTRSPSPMARPTRPSINTSSRYPSQSQTSPPRPSPSYSYSPVTTAEPSPYNTARPAPPRRSETSYYGEVPATKTTRYEYPSADRDYDSYGTAQFNAKLKPEHIAMASGYSTRRPSVAGHSARPAMSRGTAY